jgi:adenylate kinase family enzyme
VPSNAGCAARLAVLEANSGPPTPQRLVVVGASGSGKTTLARRLAERLQLSHIELDRLYWLPGWSPRPLDDFRQLVEQRVQAPGWVADGNYKSVRDVIWPRARQAIWLNYAFPIVLVQLTRRTLASIVTRREVVPGCRETFANSFLSRESVIWYAVGTYRERRKRYAAWREDPTLAHLAWRELRSPRETRQFLAELEAAAPVPAHKQAA